MRILLVSHDFLPEHPSGTEIYTYQLGIHLRERGHDVHVFTTEKDVSRPNLSVRLRHYDGLPVHEIFNNLFYQNFAETWDCPPAARTFGLFLDDLQPDVVHFMHLMYLSVGCVEEAAKRGISIVFTLHDYWLQCARFGQRIHADGSICHDIDFERCGGCLESFKYGQSRVERVTAKALSAVRSVTGVDLAPPARRMADGLRRRKRQADEEELGVELEQLPIGRSGEESSEPHALSDRAQRLAEEVGRRDRALRERLLPVVHRFVAPSRFLRARFVEWGIPEEQILFNRAGIDVMPFEGVEKSEGTGLRVAYIGTLAPHKGVHILLQAWAGIDAELRAKGDLVVFGPHAHYPVYLKQLERMADEGGARMAGGLDPEGVRRALADIDLLIVPSVWYENSPLIILEALATRTPLAVSDLGGMSELVEPGVSGFHFPVGQPAELGELLAGLLRDRSPLDTLYPDALPVKPIEVDAEELESLYEESLAARQEPG